MMAEHRLPPYGGPVLVGLGTLAAAWITGAVMSEARPGRLVYNTGISFGMLATHPAAATGLEVLGLAGLAVLAVYARRLRFPIAVVLGGGLANLLVRLTTGHIVDYWHVPPYPYWFNLADVFIRIGLLALVVVWLRGHGAERAPSAKTPRDRARNGPHAVNPADRGE